MAQGSVFLWFSHDAAGALAHYRSIFGDDCVVAIDGGTTSSFMTATIEVGGVPIVVFNGEPYGTFEFSLATSVVLTCEDQAEVDRLWAGLTDGGEPGQCGWLKDRFGFSWQIVPRRFGELMGDDDPSVRDRVFAAMRQMGKFDVAALEAAARG